MSNPFFKSIKSRFFERLKIAKVADGFKIGRLSAAARNTVGRDADAFLEALGTTARISVRTRHRIKTGMDEFAPLQNAWQDSVKRCEEVFWNGAVACPLSAKARRQLHHERRAKAEACLRPLAHFGFLLKKEVVPAIKFEIPAPEQVFNEFQEAIVNPATLYGPPAAFPRIEASHPIAGPSGREYLIRYPSPSRLMRDTVYARIFDPQSCAPGRPTLIFSGGFGMAYDQFTYWPEEDHLGRFLAARGVRVALIESPWHGRRTCEGYSSGEPFLATAPVGCFSFLSAQVQETAVLIDWARTSGASVVVVAGMSLGGMVTEQLVARCKSWPEYLRPDAALLGASSHNAEQVVRESALAKKFGLPAALRSAGWNEHTISKLRSIFNPSSGPGIDPDRIIAVLGRHDSIVPFSYGIETAREWGLPAENITIWNVGHLGVLQDLIRTKQGQGMFLRAIEKAQQAVL